MAVTRLSGGLTPANGSDPRTFPAIWNATADDIEAAEASIGTLQTDVSGLQTTTGTLTNQSVRVYDDATARDAAITSPTEGMVVYLKDSDQLQKYTGSAWVNAAPQTILQVVTATDSTERTTASTSFVDGNLSVSITPKDAGSTLVVEWAGNLSADTHASAPGASVQLTDSSNTALSGAEQCLMQYGSGTGFNNLEWPIFIRANVAASNTSARTYKLRFRNTNSTARLKNAARTGRLTVWEVAP